MRRTRGSRHHRVTRVLTAAAAVLTLGTVAAGAAWSAWRLRPDRGPWAPDEVLGVACGAGCLAVLAWIVLGTLVAVLGHLPGRAGALAARAADAWAPALSRRIAATILGFTSLSAAAPLVATAAPSGGPPPAPATITLVASGTISAGFVPTGHGRRPASGVPEPAPSDASLPSPGWTPPAPRHRPQPQVALVTSVGPRVAQPPVVVRRGDTLWGLVRRQLGRDATDVEVALQCSAWHEANRAVIGPDPDVLVPGEILRPPPAHRHHAVLDPDRGRR